MPELRKDPVTGHWVIVGTERPRRPEDFQPIVHPPPAGSCMLCPGSERTMPPAVLTYRTHDGAAADSAWRVRVVPSKFPTLRVEGELERRGQGLYDLMNGVGAHEIIVESPHHDDTFATLSLAALEDVLHAWQERIVDLRRDTRIRSVVIYRTPFDHPHSQVLATPTPPPDLQRELAHARSYHDYRERCLLCDILHQETHDGLRIVAELDHVLAFVPFAARTPFETWLLPRRHLAGYEHVTGQERRDLARVLRILVRRLHALVPGVGVAFVLHSAPPEENGGFFHWHVEVTPEVRMAGLEPTASGFAINPLLPEDAARYLRAPDA
jgi:UDPglucose--hexose-1-phosphate uridylyltransferase